MALNGAEPVSPDAVRRFTERFAPHGFAPTALTPVYGLAECSRRPWPSRPGRGRRRSTSSTARPSSATGEAMPVAADDPPCAACSSPAEFPSPATRSASSTKAATRWRSGARVGWSSRDPRPPAAISATREATAKLVHGDWRDSGDLAYVADGEIYVTGRVKDIIIRGGRNLYPQELEEAVGEVPGIRQGLRRGVRQPRSGTGTERLVVLAETRERTHRRWRACAAGSATQLSP